MQVILRQRHVRKHAILLSAALVLSSQSMQVLGGNGNWIVTNGNWSNPANWAGGAIADGSGSTATFGGPVDLVGSATVTLDSARSIGGMDFADTNPTTTGDWKLAGAFPLTLAGVTPTISVASMANGSEVLISAPLLGNAGLAKTGAGKLRLSGANSYTGTTTILDGIVSVSNNNNLGAASAGIALNNGTLDIASPVTISHPLSFSGSNSAINLPFRQTVTYSGTITGGGPTSVLNILTNGTLVLATPCTYDTQSALRIDSGIVKLGVHNALPIGSRISNLTEGELDLAGFDQTLSDMGDAYIENYFSLTTSTLKITGTSMSEGSIDGNISLDMSGTYLRLGGRTAIYDYTGTTTVNSGTLELAAVRNYSMPILVKSSGHLIVKSHLQPSYATSVNNYRIDVQGTGTLEVGSDTPTTIGRINATILNSETTIINNGEINLGATGGTTRETSTIKGIQGVGELWVRTSKLIISELSVHPITTVNEVGLLDVTDATLDLTNNALVIHSEVTSNTERDIQFESILSGMNGMDANGQARWNGLGIVSSTARTKNILAGVDVCVIGVISNHDLTRLAADGGAAMAYDATNPWLGTFSNVGADDILMRMTYAGDTNLDGMITIDDYNNIDGTYSGLLATNYGWVSGDFDLNGSITIDDYNAIDTGYLYKGGQLTQGFVASRTAMFGADYVAHLEQVAAAFASVPEPTSLGIFALAASALLGRRRNRRN